MKMFILAGLVLMPALTYAQDTTFYRPHLDTRLKPGNDRTIFSPEIFLPLRQDPDRLFFADIRAMFDQAGAKEGNLGLGYRVHDAEDERIYGVYGFFDRRLSENNVYHSQLTFGAETLSETWDARANLYIPLTKSKVIDVVDLTSSVAGNNIFITGGNFREEGLAGFDAELGYQVAQGLRLFGGGFVFDSDNSETLSGGRARAQLDMNDYVRVGLEWQKDNIRGEQKFAELRLRFPFGPKPEKTARGLRKRMTESVVRDIDIVTQNVAPTADQKVTVPLLNDATSLPQEVIFVDNSLANGTGTSENPFNNIADAMTAAGANDIVYIRVGDGTTTNLTTTVNLNANGMQLLGSGVPVSFSDDLFSVPGFNLPSGINLIPAELTPNIASIINISADNTILAGLDIANRVNVLPTAENTLLSNLRVTNNVAGIVIGASGQLTNGVTLRQILVEDVGDYGIDAFNVNNLTAVDLVLNDSDFTGFSLTYDLAGTYTGPVIDQVTGVNNPADVVAIYTTAAGAVVNNAQFKNITSVNNGTAFWGVALNGGQMNNLLVENVTVVDNDYWGVGLLSGDPGTSISATLNNLSLSSIDSFSVTYPGSGLVLMNVQQATVNNSQFISNASNGVVVSNDAFWAITGGSTVTFNNSQFIGNPVGILQDYSTGLAPTVNIGPGNLFIANGVNQQSTIIP